MSDLRYGIYRSDGDREKFARALAEVGVDQPLAMPLIKECALGHMTLIVLGGTQVPPMPNEIPVPFAILFIEHDEDTALGPVEYDGPKLRNLIKRVDMACVNSSGMSYAEIYECAARGYRYEINTIIVETMPSQHDRWMEYLLSLNQDLHMVEMRAWCGSADSDD